MLDIAIQYFDLQTKIYAHTHTHTHTHTDFESGMNVPFTEGYLHVDCSRKTCNTLGTDYVEVKAKTNSTNCNYDSLDSSMYSEYDVAPVILDTCVVRPMDHKSEMYESYNHNFFFFEFLFYY